MHLGSPSDHGWGINEFWLEEENKYIYCHIIYSYIHINKMYYLHLNHP